ncbi:MAG: hypothetical protein KAR16_01010 [Bacteroidales bacterium]|nr:hypothetical protein [Bacteroidales bacterium]
MSHRTVLLALAALLLFQPLLKAQTSDTVVHLTGIIYDELFIPVPATHVININSHQGDVTDTLGIFRLPVHASDTLLILNIAFRDTLVAAESVSRKGYITLKKKLYPLLEARVFVWGSSYDDFKEAFIEMPNQQTMGESMGLPQQDPEKVPLEMDEKAIKSPALLITSPVSFFYYNFNKHAKSARKVYWLEKNREKHKIFDGIINGDNLSDITSLSGPKLVEFQAFLLERMVCDFNCTELAIYKEIHGLWNVFQELDERGMLNSNKKREE